MTEREVELQVRIWTDQGVADSIRLFRQHSGADEYKYLKRRVTIDDILLEMLKVVDYIDLGVGDDDELVPASIYKRGINAYSQLVVHLQLSVVDEVARNQLIAKIKASNSLWESFKP